LITADQYAQLRHAIANTEVTINVSVDTLKAIVEGGGLYKTVWEVKKSSGGDESRMADRETAEQSCLCYPKFQWRTPQQELLEHRSRPVYGALNPLHLGVGAAEQYGAVALVLKPEKKQRCTFWVGDAFSKLSFGSCSALVATFTHLDHVLLDYLEGILEDYGVAKLRAYISLALADRHTTYRQLMDMPDQGATEKKTTGFSFWEVHYHGPLHFPADFAYIRADYCKLFGSTKHATLIKLARAANLPVYWGIPGNNNWQAIKDDKECKDCFEKAKQHRQRYGGDNADLCHEPNFMQNFTALANASPAPPEW
jgi:hypothetical protein